MPKYSYKAKDENGKLVTGLLQAADERDLHQKLQADNKYLSMPNGKKKRRDFAGLRLNICLISAGR